MKLRTNLPPPGRSVMLAATVAVALSLVSGAGAEPNGDIVGYCRSTTISYGAMATCIDTERKARNLQGCLDALGNWPKDVPCPTEWLQAVVRNIRENLPCTMHEIGGNR